LPGVSTNALLFAFLPLLMFIQTVVLSPVGLDFKQCPPCPGRRCVVDDEAEDQERDKHHKQHPEERQKRVGAKEHGSSPPALVCASGRGSTRKTMVIKCTDFCFAGEMAVAYLSLVLAIAVILVGAKFFTNGVEWLGIKLGLARGAVGSILAALGTALPETMIPVVAILLGRGGVGEEVGVGAILGAPFMLATMGFVVIGGTSILVNRRRRAYVRPQPALARRDLGFFLGAYVLAIIAAFLSREYRIYVVFLLLGGYVCFVARALTQGERCGASDNLQPLAVAPRLLDPPLALVTGQVLFAFMMIVFGAKVFVESIGTLSHQFGIAPFIFALLVAPVATELPELTNSIIWIKERKDTLAVGNVTGAMVFQSSVVPTIGIAFTSWHLTPAACLSAVLALISALLAYRWISRRHYLNGWMMVTMGLSFYIVYAALVTAGFVH